MLHEAAMKNAYREALFGTWLSIAINAILGAGKIAAGLLGSSFALVSDGLHSFSDLATSLATVIGFHIARKPPDAEHPYGHSRAEAVIGAYVACALGAAGVWVGYKAVLMLGREHELPAAFTLWVAGVSIVIKEALFQYKIRLGRRLRSGSLIADAWDHRSDAFSAAAVLIGVGLTRYAHWYSADDFATLFVAGTLVWAAIVLLRDSTNELMDAQQDPEILAQLRAAALEAPGVRDVETLWVRKAGLEYFVDIHIEVDPSLTVRESHEIASRTRDRLRQAMPTIHDVLVHVEPHERD